MDTNVTKPSVMDLKFANSNGASYTSPPTVSKWKPKYYFVYGTLMDPDQARSVLRRKDRPKMVHATLEGWAIKMWGEYPALINGRGEKIHGRAFMVNTKQEEEFLRHYETHRYTTQVCYIDIENEGEQMARTFRWVASQDELKDGTFDLKDWRLNKLDKH